MRKGTKHTLETRRKISEKVTFLQTGKKRPSSFGLNISKALKGRKFTDEARKRMSESAKKRKSGPLSEEHRKKISEIHTGMRYTLEQRKKLCGENHPNWQGGKTPIGRKIRTSTAYKEWRTAVLERDNWTCVWCSLRGGWNKELKKRIALQADHIKPFAYYPELRLVLDNGRTLCSDCHKTTETYGTNKK